MLKLGKDFDIEVVGYSGNDSAFFPLLNFLLTYLRIKQPALHPYFNFTLVSRSTIFPDTGFAISKMNKFPINSKTHYDFPSMDDTTTRSLMKKERGCVDNVKVFSFPEPLRSHGRWRLSAQ